MNENLSGKKVLFFSVKTFNLEIEISKKMKEMGAFVTYFDERPANNNFTKGIIRLRRSIYEKRISKYYQNILKELKPETFDYLFVNRGEVIPEFFLVSFKERNPKCEFIFFTWDSFSNHSYPKTILKFFDKKSSFDPSDCIKYDLDFRPLFYLDAFCRNSNHAEVTENSYKMLFLGTAHSDRYEISTRVANWFREHDYVTFCYYYMHGRLVYFYKLMFDPEFKKFDYKKLSFKSLTKTEIVALYQQSEIILDINHPRQSGLTMRTLEAIGANKKLITTNRNIIKYPFYNSNNIFMLDRNTLRIDEEFLKVPYCQIDLQVKESLSIGGWLNDIFFERNTKYWNEFLTEQYELENTIS